MLLTVFFHFACLAQLYQPPTEVLCYKHIIARRADIIHIHTSALKLSPHQMQSYHVSVIYLQL